MRITVPEGKVAIVLDQITAKKLYIDATLMRKHGPKYFRQNEEVVRESLAQYILAYLEGQTNA